LFLVGNFLSWRLLKCQKKNKKWEEIETTYLCRVVYLYVQFFKTKAGGNRWDWNWNTISLVKIKLCRSTEFKNNFTRNSVSFSIGNK
jgi:hypothetical protein